jgi:DNA ligase (NAD+)
LHEHRVREVMGRVFDRDPRELGLDVIYDAGGPLAGQTVVLTGALDALTRDAAEELIERAGGRVGDSIPRRTAYVVVGANPGGKLDDARRLGVKLLDERELMAMGGPR